jgi:hypothetical protein
MGVEVLLTGPDVGDRGRTQNGGAASEIFFCAISFAGKSRVTICRSRGYFYLMQEQTRFTRHFDKI